MRITRDNVDQVKDIGENLQHYLDDLIDNAEAWLEAQDDESADPDETRDARETMVEAIENIDGLCRDFVLLGDKWALYESGQTKKLKVRIAELEAEVERLRGNS